VKNQQCSAKHYAAQVKEKKLHPLTMKSSGTNIEGVNLSEKEMSQS